MSLTESLPLLDALSLPLLLLDRERRVLAPNAAFCAWTGAGARRWSGIAVRELGGVGPLLDEAVQRCVEERQTQRLVHALFQPRPGIDLRADVICTTVANGEVAFAIGKPMRRADVADTMRELFGEDDLYVVKVKGQSMIDGHIADEDLVTIAASGRGIEPKLARDHGLGEVAAADEHGHGHDLVHREAVEGARQ